MSNSDDSQISPFAQKMISGSLPTIGDWESLLIEAHNNAPSMTSKVYANYHASHGRTSYEVLASAVKRVSGDRKPHVLDLACGDGFLIQYVVDQADRVTAIDMNATELDVARQRWKGDSRVNLVLAKAQELPLPSGSVDIVLCHMALMLIKPVESVLMEIRRVLRPGGVLAFITLGNENRAPSFLGERGVIAEFFKRKFPNAGPGLSDLRFRSTEGMREVLQSVPGYVGIEVEEFTVSAAVDEAGHWDSLRDVYVIGMLKDADRLELQRDFQEFFLRHAKDGLLSSSFPMLLVTTRVEEEMTS